MNKTDLHVYQNIFVNMYNHVPSFESLPDEIKIAVYAFITLVICCIGYIVYHIVSCAMCVCRCITCPFSCLCKKNDRYDL